MLPATWLFRNRDIGVLTSLSRDGEYIARVIRRFGFVPVRGSSSRGGQRGLLEMETMVKAGGAVAFTIDGPRGPRYVAKKGPVMLARLTGIPITAFYVAVEKPWVLKTWDAMVHSQAVFARLRAGGEKHLCSAGRRRRGARPPSRGNAGRSGASDHLRRIAVFITTSIDTGLSAR